MNDADVSARELAGRFGLSRTARCWRGTCPACGQDAFEVRTGKSGSPRVICYYGCSGAELLPAVQAALCGLWSPPEGSSAGKSGRSDAERTVKALILWSGAKAAPSTPADAYLTGRGLADLAASPALRWRADVAHPEERGRVSAMLALVVDAAGQPVAVHRTYLRSDGTGKANVTPAKASLGPVGGGAIRLDPLAPELVVGEGIETSASAGRVLDLPAWAAVSAGNLARALILPEKVRAVVIAADADGPGRRAADEAARRWRAEGRRVRVATPDLPGQDFNDLLLARGAKGDSHA
jgi:putative DNA primase/helicase